MKHPNGKTGMHQERERKLSNQYYIVQRLRNRDSRFASDPSYSFACAAFLEKSQLQRNINISFQRGKKSVTSGQSTYSLDDGFAVFDKIKNTPTYWRQAKYEMLAKLENLGPFQFFFTLSCADSRWDENFSSLLRKKGITVVYEFDSNGNDETKVQPDGEDPVPLKEYLNNKVDASQHELIRRNVLNATRNYNQRVKAFIKDIILAKNNPMAIKYYSTKVEFQGRGAGHNHGTLWADLKRMEYYLPDDNGQWRDMEIVFKKKKEDFDAKTSRSIPEIARDVREVLKSKLNPTLPDLEEDSEKKKRQNESMKLFYQIFFNSDEDYREETHLKTIISSLPLLGITSAFKKFQTHEPLLKYEEDAIIKFSTRFTTCTLNAATIGQMTEDPSLKARAAEIVEIVRAVNIHNHTRTCRKYDTTCRFGFLKFPIWRTLISKTKNHLL